MDKLEQDIRNLLVVFDHLVPELGTDLCNDENGRRFQDFYFSLKRILEYERPLRSPRSSVTFKDRRYACPVCGDIWGLPDPFERAFWLNRGYCEKCEKKIVEKRGLFKKFLWRFCK